MGVILALIFLFAALPLLAAEVKNTEVRQVGNRGLDAGVKWRVEAEK